MKVWVIAVSCAVALPVLAGCSAVSGNNDGPAVSDTTFTLAPDEPIPTPSGSLLPGESPLPRPLSEEQAVVVSFLATLPNNIEAASGNAGTLSVTPDSVLLTGVPGQETYSQQVPAGFLAFYGAAAPGKLVGENPVSLMKESYYCFSATDPADPSRFFTSYAAPEGALAALPDTVVMTERPCGAK